MERTQLEDRPKTEHRTAETLDTSRGPCKQAEEIEDGQEKTDRYADRNQLGQSTCGQSACGNTVNLWI